MKMPTIGIFVFISKENFMLSGVEHEKSFITSGPGNYIIDPDMLLIFRPNSIGSFFLISPSKHMLWVLISLP